MKLFNAFQMIILFAALPFIIGWLHKNPFQYSFGVMWLVIAAYVVEFCILVSVLYDALEKK